MQPIVNDAALFEQTWDPQAYLDAYYPTHELTADEQAILSYLVSFFASNGGRFNSAIEVGCGPTLHHVFPVVPYVDELHMADIVPANLAAIEAWLKDEPAAHNWDFYLGAVLDMEAPGQAGAHDALDERKRRVRATVTALKHVDLRQASPLGEPRTYDLVLSFYCADSATSSKEEWRVLMRHLLTLLSPGGTLIVSALRHAQHYTVGERRFPSAQIDEADLAAAFAAAGFRAEDLDFQVVEVGAWSDFASVVIARAAGLPHAIKLP